MSDAAPRERFVGALQFVLGGWLFLTAWMAYVAGANFKIVEPTTLHDSAEVFGALAEGDERRQALRFVASEINRHLFVVYGYLQIVLFAAAVGFFAMARKPSRVVLGSIVGCGVMALAWVVWLNPAIVELGRTIDFMPRDPEPPEVVRFFTLHKVAVGSELAKMALIALAGHLLSRPK